MHNAPWTVHEGVGFFGVRDSKGLTVATVPGGKSDDAASKARLIALAPELLSAAEEVLTFFTEFSDTLRSIPAERLARIVARAKGE